MFKRAAAKATSGASQAELKRAWILVAVLGVGSLSLYFCVLRGLRPLGGEHLLVLPCAALGTWWAGIQPVLVKGKDDATLAFTLAGVPVLIAVAFLKPAEVLGAVLAGWLAAQFYYRRAAHKAALNVAATVFSAAVAAVICDTFPLAGQEEIWSPRPYLVVLVGLTGYLLVKDIVIVTGIAAVSRRWRTPPMGLFFLTAGYDLMVCLCGVVLGVNMIPLDWWQTPVFFGLVAVADMYWRQTVHRKRRASYYQQLVSFGSRLARHNGGALDLVDDILQDARSILGAKKAVLVLPNDPPLSRLAMCCTLADAGPTTVTEDFEMNDLAHLVSETHGLVIGPRKRPAADLLEKAHGLQEALVAPLIPGRRGSGYVVVTDKRDKQEAYGKDDLRALKALATHAAISLRRGGLVDKLREQSDARSYEATHDSITGLANRTAFVERLEAVCQHGVGNDLVALVLFDLDGFKQVNDTLGHREGDMILAEVGRRLAKLAGRGKMVARLGGDEFVVLVERATGDEPGLSEAMGVLGTFAEPVDIEGLTLDVRASVGVAASAASRSDPMALFRHAEIAMYQAKANGTSLVFYESSKDRASLRRLTMAGHLRQAIDEGLLDLHYQPLVDLASGKVKGCEALARWVHPELGAVGPDEFIPVAERAGLIGPLTWWALETALHDLAAWRKTAHTMTVSVNLSPITLLSPRLANRVAEALERAGLAPEALTLELTETSLLADLGRNALQELAELGVGLSLDDFGTGYSSLSRLRQLPFDEVKIDRCFVTQMDSDDEAVVRSVVELARGLDKSVVAEGVEDEATMERLARLGCNAAQGFYISPPMPPRQLERTLKLTERWPSAVTAGR